MQLKVLIRWLPICTFIVVCAAYFYKSIFLGLIPFPGDILLSEYKPWQSYSYNGYTAGSIPNKAQYFDTVRQIYPWHALAADIWKSGNIPLWNPYNFSGSPLHANSQSAVFYPFHLLYILFPTVIAWTILVIAQPALAMLFTYMFLRSQALTRVSAVFGAVAFGLSLFMTVFLEYNTIGHVFMWLPLAFTAIIRLKEKSSVRWSIVYITALTMSGLAGHLQIFVVSLTAILGYMAVTLRNSKTVLIRQILLTTIGLGLISFQLIPTVTLLGESARVNQPYNFLIENLLIQPKQIFMLFSPDIFGNPATRNYTDPGSYPGKAMYVGLICLFFVHLALRNNKQSGNTKFFGGMAIILLLLVIRTPFSEWLYRIPIPLISTSSPANMIFLLSFALAVLGAHGFDTWIRKPKEKPLYSSVIFIIILGLIFALGITKYIAIVKSMWIFSAGVFTLLMLSVFILPRFIKKTWIIATVLICIQATDLWYFGQKFNPFVPASYIYPPTAVINWLKDKAGYERFWGYGSAGIEANFATAFRLYSAEGYDPLYPRSYGELLGASRNGILLRNFDTATRSDARIAPGFGNTDIAENAARLKILAITGTGYILDRIENGTDQTSYPPSQFSQVYDQDGWRIYQFRKSVPRVQFVSTIQPYTNKEEFEKIFFSDEFNPLTTALVEHPEVTELSPYDAADSASISMYSPNKVTIQTQSTGNKFMVFSDSYDPGWIATIDSESVPIHKTNYTFRGLYVPEGKHQIQFEYRPVSFYMGLKLSMISVLGLLAYGYYIYAIGKRRHHE